MISHLLRMREIEGRAPSLTRRIKTPPRVEIIRYSALFPSLGAIESVVLLGFSRDDANDEDYLLSINNTAIEIHNIWYSPINLRLDTTLRLGFQNNLFTSCLILITHSHHISVFSFAFQTETEYHEPLTHHRLEILYNKSNIASTTAPNFHAILIYSNENNVHNERYHFEEATDDFCGNVFIFIDGKLMIESAMVEVRPEMSFVFVSIVGKAFLVLKTISGEIRYITVRENDQDASLAPSTNCGNASPPEGKMIHDSNMHLKRSMKIFKPSKSCRSSWYWSDHTDIPSSPSSSTRCTCHDCKVEYGIHGLNESTTIFDSMKFLALLLRFYYKIPHTDIIDAEAVIIGQSEHYSYIIKAIGCIIKYVNPVDKISSRKTLLFRLAFNFVNGECHVLGILDLNALTTGKRADAFKQFRHKQSLYSSTKGTWLCCALEFYKKLDLASDPILSICGQQCLRYDNFGIIDASSLRSIYHPLKYYVIVNDDDCLSSQVFDHQHL